ncbi:hypothetical protein ACTFIU_011373 [Dictyostelium citrinum]
MDDNSKLFFSIWRNNYLKKKIIRYIQIINIHSFTKIITTDNIQLLYNNNNNNNNEFKSIEILFKKNEKDYEKMKKLFNQINYLPNYINELLIRNESASFYSDNHVELESMFTNDLIKIPNSITSLKFDDFFSFAINKLPSGLKILDWGKRNVNEIKIGLLPVGLEELHHNGNSALKAGSLPSTLKRLYLGSGYQVNLFETPDLLASTTALEELSINKHFNSSLSGVLPKSLTKLSFHNDGYFDQEFKVGDLPSSITELTLPESFSQPIQPNQLPSSLKSLRFTKSREWHTFKQSIEPNTLPNSLTYLRMNPAFNSPLKVGSIPSNINKLIFKNTFNQKLIDDDDNNNNNNNGNRLIPDSVTILKLDFLWNQKLSIGIFSNNLVKLYFVVGLVDAHYNKGNIQIIEPGVLPTSLKTLRLSPKFQIKEGSISFGLKSFHSFSTEQLQYLPSSVEKLKFVEHFDSLVFQDQLPPNITSLSFGKNFSKPLIITDSSCKKLKRVEFNGTVSNDLFLPSTVEILLINNIDGDLSPPPSLSESIDLSVLIERQKEYTQILYRRGSRKSIITLPKNLKSLYFGVFFNKKLKTNQLPQSLTLLELGGRYTQKLNSQSLPDSIKFLIIRGSPIFEKNYPSLEQEKEKGLLIFTHSTNYQFFEYNRKTLLKHPNYLDMIKIFSEKNLKKSEVYENDIYPYHIFPIVDKKLFKKISIK